MLGSFQENATLLMKPGGNDCDNYFTEDNEGGAI